MTEFSFCESPRDHPGSLWHIRKLTKAGRKSLGGIDTSSLCGHVMKSYGRDLDLRITEKNLKYGTCTACLYEYEKHRKI